MSRRVVLLALTLLVWALPSAAVQTQYYRYARMEDYQDSSFRELVLADDGSWRLGPRFEELLADEVAYFSELGDDGHALLLAGGGSPGKLILFDPAQGRHRQILTADDLLFSCVETLGRGDWVVGSGPGGVVFRVNGEGEATPFLETGEDFVWDLLKQGDTLWIATGSRGAILRYDLKRGSSETFATLPDQSAFCLALDAQGRLLAGSSGEGLLYRFDHDGVMAQLADFDAGEVQAVLPEADGSIVVAVADSDADCEENCAAVYRLEASGVLEKLLGSDSAFIGDLLPAPEGGIWVAAGKPGELDRLTGPYHGEIYASEPERYYSDLAPAGGEDGRDLWLLQSKPARLVRIWGLAERGTLSSEVLDLGNRSVGGALRLEGDLPRGCSFAVEARCGHGAEPEEGWTEWRPCHREEDSYRMDLPAARFFQWRIEFKGEGKRSPRLYRVTASFLPLNRSPLIGNLTVLRPAEGLFSEGLELGGRPFTQVLERGVRVQYQQKAGPDLADDPDVPGFRGLREVHWDWLDPDGDRLRATIELQREGEVRWQLLAKDYENSTYTWDTRGLPDGRYRLRVTADDGLDNSRGRQRRSTLLSERVRLDGAPPVCSLELERAGETLRLRGKIADDALLTRLEYRLDDEPWQRLAGPNGLMDRSRMELDVDLGDTEGRSRVELRAGDEFGNWGYFRSSLESAR